MGGIRLTSAFKAQSIGENIRPVSMFAVKNEDKMQKNNSTMNSEDSEEEKQEMIKFDLSTLKTHKKKEPILVNTDKRRL